MLAWFAIAFAGGELVVQSHAVVLRDPVVSRRTYVGALVGPQFGWNGGLEWRWNLEVAGGVGSLGPLGLGRRSYSFTTEDVISGETETNTLVAPRFILGTDASLGVERGWAGAELGWSAYYASGVALGTYALSSFQLRPMGVAEREVGASTFGFRAGVDLLGVVTRFPWSANPIQPDKTIVGGFFATNTQLTGPWRHVGGRMEATLRPGDTGWLGTLSAELMHDWEPLPLTVARAGAAFGWSR